MTPLRDFVGQFNRVCWQLGLTRKAVADRLGIHPSCLTHALKRGANPELDTLTRFAAAIGYRVRISLEPEPNGPAREAVEQAMKEMGT